MGNVGGRGRDWSDPPLLSLGHRQAHLPQWAVPAEENGQLTASIIRHHPTYAAFRGASKCRTGLETTYESFEGSDKLCGAWYGAHETLVHKLLKAGANPEENSNGLVSELAHWERACALTGPMPM